MNDNNEKNIQQELDKRPKWSNVASELVDEQPCPLFSLQSAQTVEQIWLRNPHSCLWSNSIICLGKPTGCTSCVLLCHPLRLWLILMMSMHAMMQNKEINSNSVLTQSESDDKSKKKKLLIKLLQESNKYLHFVTCRLWSSLETHQRVKKRTTSFTHGLIRFINRTMLRCLEQALAAVWPISTSRGGSLLPLSLALLYLQLHYNIGNVLLLFSLTQLNLPVSRWNK